MSNELTIKNWGKIAGLTHHELLQQVEVGFSELIELVAGALEKDPQELMDGLVDVDWMFSLTKSLADDPTVNATVGSMSLDNHFAELVQLIRKNYPGLVETYFLDFKQAVLESNFSKFCKSEADAIASVEKYKAIGVTTYYRCVQGTFVIRSKESQTDINGVNYGKDKILKGIDYFKPKLVVIYPINELNKELYATPQLTLVDIEQVIDTVDWYVVEDTTTTVCFIKTYTGFILTGTNSCLNKAKWDRGLGKDQSYEMALDKLWELEGYYHSKKAYLEQNK